MKNIDELKEEIAHTDNAAERIGLMIQLAHDTIYSDPVCSLSYAQRAWNEARKTADVDLELKSLISICVSCIYNNDCPNQLKWIDLLESRGNELKRNYAVGRANLFRYSYFIKSGNHKKGREALIKALDTYTAGENKNGQATCFISLGNIEFNNTNYEKANEYYQKALPLVDIEQLDILFTLRQNIATVLTMMKKYHEAWDVYQDILDQIPDNDISNRSLVLINLGFLCMNLGELDVAKEYYSEAIELTVKLPADEVHIKAHCGMAETLLMQGDKSKAFQYLKSAEIYAGKSKNPALMKSVYLIYVMHYKESNQLTEMEKYQKKILELESQLS